MYQDFTWLGIVNLLPWKRETPTPILFSIPFHFRVMGYNYFIFIALIQFTKIASNHKFISQLTQMNQLSEPTIQDIFQEHRYVNTDIPTLIANNGC